MHYRTMYSMSTCQFGVYVLKGWESHAVLQVVEYPGRQRINVSMMARMTRISEDPSSGDKDPVC